MKQRIWACAAILAVMIAAAVYSTAATNRFTAQLNTAITAAEQAVLAAQPAAAQAAAGQGLAVCGKARIQLAPFLKTERINDIQSALAAAQSYCAHHCAEDALAELCRARAYTQIFARLGTRWL